MEKNSWGLYWSPLEPKITLGTKVYFYPSCQPIPKFYKNYLHTNKRKIAVFKVVTLKTFYFEDIWSPFPLLFPLNFYWVCYWIEPILIFRIVPKFYASTKIPNFSQLLHKLKVVATNCYKKINKVSAFTQFFIFFTDIHFLLIQINIDVTIFKINFVFEVLKFTSVLSQICINFLQDQGRPQ